MNMLRRLIPLVIVFLIGYAGWHVAPKYLNYFEFKNAIEEIARFSSGRGEGEVQALVMQAAQKYEIPLQAQQVRIRLESGRSRIDVSYQEQLEFAPGYFYPWDVTINADTMVARVNIR